MLLYILLFFCTFIQNTRSMEPAAFTTCEQIHDLIATECKQIKVLLDEAAILKSQGFTELRSISTKPKTRATTKRLLGAQNKILKAEVKYSQADVKLSHATAALKIAKEHKLTAICDSCKAKEIAARTIIPKE